MPDQIGSITVPEITPSGTFPIISDYGYGQAEAREIVIHRLGSGNAKIEQRFYLGNGAKRFTVKRASLTEDDRVALRDFWEARQGSYQSFTYNAPNDSGIGTTAFTCHFADEPLSWEALTHHITSFGVTLVEIPTTDPSYTLNSTETRFPGASLEAALLAQVQEFIPLIKITARESGYPVIFLSDRRCTIGGQLYQARLVDVEGIAQSIGNESDQAQFVFGNADRVMRDVANDVDLYRASIEYSLFHVGEGIKLDLWKGDIIDWAVDAGPEFGVSAAEGIYELNLPYPTRRISRTCWKDFDDGQACPFGATGGGHTANALDTAHFSEASSTVCDKGYETPNGCLAHTMKRFFGGIVAEPQSVRIKDNSTGFWGFRRSAITSTSLVAESIYDQVMTEIYTGSQMLKITGEASARAFSSRLPVKAKIAIGREESDFYDALGIVGEGPIVFGGPLIDRNSMNQLKPGHTLDGQMHHGSPGMLGLRQVVGNDPTGEKNFFALGQVGQAHPDAWRQESDEGSYYKDNFSA